MGIKINSVAGGSCGSIVPEQRGAASASDPCDTLDVHTAEHHRYQHSTSSSAVLTVQY
jgi:hypothetical protein